MQRDLFRDFAAGEVKKKAESVTAVETEPSFFERVRLVLTLDKVILWVLVNVTALVFVYSFGIERGMSVARKKSFAPDTAKRTSAGEVWNPLSDSSVTSSSREVRDGDPAASDTRQTGLVATGTIVADAADSLNWERPYDVAEPPPFSPDLSDPESQNLFTIQLITYNRKDQAQRELERLRQKGYRSFIIPSGKFYQVCIETFPDKAQAFQKLISLRVEGYDRIYRGAYVRPVRK